MPLIELARADGFSASERRGKAADTASGPRRQDLSKPCQGAVSMSFQFAKKNKVLPVAVCDEDIAALDAIRSRVVFPPSRSLLACGILREGIDRLNRRRLSMRTISAMSSTGPIAEQFAEVEETDPGVLTVTCLFCLEKFIYSARGARRSEIERDKREHVCKGAK